MKCHKDNNYECTETNMIICYTNPADCGTSKLSGDFLDEIAVKPKQTTGISLKHLQLINDALKKAKHEHPKFPSDIVYMLSIVAEESGEAVRAANNVMHHNGKTEDVIKEIGHTIATCIRTLEGLEG